MLREDHYIIKIIILKLINRLLESLKERYISLLSDVVPFVTEILEDPDEKVQMESFKLIKFIEKQTGEDIKNYLD
jgi:hypothetical protein